MKKTLLLLFALSAFMNLCHAQNPFVGAGKNVMDSLKVELQKSNEDTSRLRIYLELGAACDRKDYLLYAEPALQLADKLLLQTLPDSTKKMIRKQKAGAYWLAALYYSEGTQIHLKKENDAAD